MNISKKTKKKIYKIILSNHFKKRVHTSEKGFCHYPSNNSPLSAIWHHIEVRPDGTIWGYLLDDRCAYMVTSSIIRKKVRQQIKSPKQFFNPACYSSCQSEQILNRLSKMNRNDVALHFIGSLK